MASPTDEEKRKRDTPPDALDGRCPVESRRNNERTGRAYPREDTPPAPCSVLCGPRSCSTLPASIHSNDDDDTPPETKRRRLWGLRGLVKMFRRRVKRKGGDSSGSPQPPPPALRARSASELTVDQPNRSSSGPYNQGLSVSHDSVFSPDSPPEPTHTAPPALALATRGVNMAELKVALRRRRGGDSGSGDDDPGLPLSPQTSPTTLDVLNHGLKSCSRTTQSTCSDGSLLSMGSSEYDEDSFGAGGSLHSSKASLIDGRYQVVDHEPAAGSAPLSHKAARHKIAVKPRRTHGVPRSRRQPQALSSSLPTTPEVNEDFSAKVVENSEVAPPLLLNQEPTWGSRPVLPNGPSRKADDILAHNSTIDGGRHQLPLEVISADATPEKMHREHLPMDVTDHSSGVIRKHSRGAYDASCKVTEKPPTRCIEEHASKYRRETPLKKSGASARQKSDPAHLPERGAEPQVRRSQAKAKNQNGSQRSSSVEGRLEGNEAQHASPNSPQEGAVSYEPCHKVSRENFNDVLRVTTVEQHESSYSETVTSSNYSHTEMSHLPPTHSRVFSPPSENSHSKRDSISSQSTLGERSSTDSLTTTPLPGIYIRSSGHTRNSQLIERSFSENTPLTSTPKPSSGLLHAKERAALPHPEAVGGPRSLDSSLTLVHHEEILKKTSSVNYVSTSSESHTHTPRPSPDILPSANAVLPAGSLTSSNSSTPRCRSRNNSLGDELEKEDLGKVALRPIKREHSLKRTDAESPSVPEFMRIQLNKVQSKGSSVIFNTEQLPQIINEQSNATQVGYENREIMGINKENTTVEKSERKSPINIEENKVIIDKQDNLKLNFGAVPKREEIERQKSPVDVLIEEKPKERDEATQDDAFYTSTVVATSHVYNPSRKTPPPDETAGTNDETLKRREEKKAGEEIVLRRPSVMDRSSILDQSLSGHSSPVPREEPELFKVFARRSFKLKDGDVDVDPEDEKEKPSEVGAPAPLIISKQENKIRNTTNNIIAYKENLPPTFISKPIQSKRFSLGSGPLPLSKLPEPPKSTVIVLSGNEANEIQLGKSQSPDLVHSETKVKKQSGLKSQSFTQYSVYKVKPKQDTSLGASDASVEGIANPGSSTKPESKLSASQINFNKFAVGLMGPSNPETKDKNAQSESSVAKKSTRSVSNPRKKEEKTESEIKPVAAGVFVRPTLTRATSLPWQSKEAQTDELIVSNLPPLSVSSAEATQSAPLPPSKILDSFVSKNESTTTLKSVSSTDSLGSRDATALDQEDASGQDAKNSDVKIPPAIITEAKNSSISPFGHGVSANQKDTETEAGTEHCQRQNSFEHAGGIGGSDWRVLVRQRREDRLKQTKTTDPEEIIMEQTRPASSGSRNSKVLEMANNFQKLQVA